MKTIFHQLAYLFAGHISSTTGKDNSINYFHKFMHQNFDTFLWFSYSIYFWWHSSLTNSRTFRLIYIFFCAKKNLHQIILYQIQTHYDLASHLADISCDDNSISRFWLKYNHCAASVGGDRSSSLGELCLRSCSPYIPPRRRWPHHRFCTVWTITHTHDLVMLYAILSWVSGLILGLRPANERRRYLVTTSLIGWWVQA